MSASVAGPLPFPGIDLHCKTKTAFQIKILKSQDLENSNFLLLCFIVPSSPDPHPFIHPSPRLRDPEEPSPRPSRVQLYKQSGERENLHDPRPSPSPRSGETLKKK